MYKILTGPRGLFFDDYYEIEKQDDWILTGDGPFIFYQMRIFFS